MMRHVVMTAALCLLASAATVVYVRGARVSSPRSAGAEMLEGDASAHPRATEGHAPPAADDVAQVRAELVACKDRMPVAARAPMVERFRDGDSDPVAIAAFRRELDRIPAGDATIDQLDCRGGVCALQVLVPTGGHSNLVARLQDPALISFVGFSLRHGDTVPGYSTSEIMIDRPPPESARERLTELLAAIVVRLGNEPSCPHGEALAELVAHDGVVDVRANGTACVQPILRQLAAETDVKGLTDAVVVKRFAW